MQEESCNHLQDLGPWSPWDVHGPGRSWSVAISLGLALASLTCHLCGPGTGGMQYVLKQRVSSEPLSH